MIQIAATTLLAACGLLVVYAEGLHWIALWNLLPLLLAGRVVARGTGAARRSWSGVAFAGVATLATGLLHTAWVCDWGGTQTGSSTAGLIFLFAPIYALVLGTVGWAVVRVVERLSARLTGRGDR